MSYKRTPESMAALEAEVKARSAERQRLVDLTDPSSRLFKQKKRASERERLKRLKAAERERLKRERAILKRELIRVKPLLRQHGLAIVKTAEPSPAMIASLELKSRKMKDWWKQKRLKEAADIDQELPPLVHKEPNDQTIARYDSSKVASAVVSLQSNSWL
jgi:hypothetical protein